jgi:chorismate synthase
MEIRIHGRHDPVIVPRAVVVVEAMTALTLVDALMEGMSARIDYLKKIWKG